ncbi:hypothetical protein FLL45_00950 [Aliikangiella marina]|uniref:Uncharacterized protein n=1 Tax=Aliikangiella marina TaxID=1712262 RepID=A0A545THC9_9GAMM|nr:hypothetical protein [Aliikangiella marina]TQV76561.1 hypothetical protein FLL45_00950 [Aliikangiella marina]
MNWIMIKHLIAKDWHFNRIPLMLYTLVGFIALAMLPFNQQGLFYVSMVLLISSVIVVGAHLVFVTVVIERKEQTLPFVMSLPISFMDFTMAKLLVNLGAFMTIWFVLVAGMMGIIFSVDTLPNGLVPYATIALIELIVAYVLVLSVAIVTESEAWTIVVMTLTNVCVSLFWYFLGSFESIAKYIEGEVAVWNSTAFAFIAIEIGIIATMIGLVFYFQSRKTEFL